MFVGALIFNFSTNVYMLIVGNFFVGMATSAASNLEYVMLKESCSTNFSQKATCIMMLMWAVYEILLSASFYGFSNWRYSYMVLMTIPVFIFLILIYFIEETSQYLLCKRLDDKLVSSLKKISK